MEGGRRTTVNSLQFIYNGYAWNKHLELTSWTKARTNGQERAGGGMEVGRLCGQARLEEAKRVFAQNPDISGACALVAAFAKSKQNNALPSALNVLDILDKHHLRPTDYLYVSLVNICRSHKEEHAGRQVHAHIIRSGHKPNNFLLSTLLNFYCACGAVDDAYKVLQSMKRRNVIDWTTLISAYKNTGREEQALQLFDQMQQEGVEPNNITIISVLSACTSLQTLEHGKKVHKQITEKGLPLTMELQTALINLYGKCGELEEAVRLFQQMQHQGLEPNHVTYISLLRACASRQALDYGKRLHKQIIEKGYPLTLELQTTLINFYGKCGELDEAHAIFRSIPQPGTVSWTALMTAYEQNDKEEQVLRLYEQMQEEGIYVDNVTYTSVLTACATMKAIEYGKKVHKQIITKGVPPDTGLQTALINFYGKCGELDEARTIFNAALQKNTVIWSAMIAACAQNGQGKEALALLEQMHQQGVPPNEVTLLNVLNACSHAGLVDEGKQCFASMTTRFHITPTMKHYGTLVDILARAGRLQEAEQTIHAMPFAADDTVWKALLGGCRIHGDVETARRAYDQLRAIVPSDASIYVLMGNIHSGKGEMREAHR
jgi:pentatricopeptide repeat protein